MIGTCRADFTAPGDLQVCNRVLVGQIDDAVLSFPGRFGNFYINGYYTPSTNQNWNGATLRSNFFLYNTTNPSSTNMISATTNVYGDSNDFIAGVNQITSTVALFGPINVTGIRSISPFLSLGANWTGTISAFFQYSSTYPLVSPGASGTILNYHGTDFSGTPASGVDVTNVRLHRCGSSVGGSFTNVCFSSLERTGGTFNAAYHIDSNSATCGAGLVAGTAFDTCQYRGAANVWTYNSGTSLWIPRYACVGCSSVPADVATGDFTSQRYVASATDRDSSTAPWIGNFYRSCNGSSCLSGAIYGGVNSIVEYFSSATPATSQQPTGYRTDLRIGHTGDITNAFGYRFFASVPSTRNGVIQNLFGFRSNGYTVTSPAVGNVTNLFHFSTSPSSGTGIATYTTTNEYGYDCAAPIGTATGVCYRAAASTSPLGAAFWVNSNSATDGASYCAGTGFDACMGRKGTALWGLKTGNSFQLDGGGTSNVAVIAINGNLRLGSAVSTALSVAATTGWPLMPSVAGTPTGVPQNESVNSAAFTWDRTNKRFCVRDQPTNAWTCLATTSSGVSSITGTTGQITASASTGAVTLATPNPVQPAQAAPSVFALGAAIGTGGGQGIGNVVGNNNAFAFDVTTGATVSTTGVIVTFSWASAWDITQDINGPACTVSIINAEGTADASSFMTTYGPRLYAIGTSGNTATRLDVKLAGGTGAVLPTGTTFKLLVRCSLSR